MVAKLKTLFVQLIICLICLIKKCSGRWTAKQLQQFHRLRTGYQEDKKVYWHLHGTLINEYSGKFLASVEGVETCQHLNLDYNVSEFKENKRSIFDKFRNSIINDQSNSTEWWNPLIRKIFTERNLDDSIEKAAMTSKKVYGCYNIPPAVVQASHIPSTFWQWLKLPITANFLPAPVPKGDDVTKQVIVHRLTTDSNLELVATSLTLPVVSAISKGRRRLGVELDPTDRETYKGSLFPSYDICLDIGHETQPIKSKPIGSTSSWRNIMEKVKHQNWIGFGHPNSDSHRPCREQYVYYYDWDCSGLSPMSESTQSHGGWHFPRRRAKVLYRRTGPCPAWYSQGRNNLCTLEIKGLKCVNKNELKKRLRWLKWGGLEEDGSANKNK